MKIGPNDLLSESPLKPSKPINGPDRPVFQKELDRALEHRKREDRKAISFADKKLHGTKGFSPSISPLSFSKIGSVHDEREGPFDLIQEAEKGLDLLEIYRDALEDTSLPMEQISPLAEGLERKAQTLKTLTDRIPEENPLRAILNHIAILTMVEAIKFQWGDLLK